MQSAAAACCGAWPAQKEGQLRLAVVASHPIQYHAPLFRCLAQQVDLTVFFAHRVTAADQAKAGFEIGFAWDVDLLTGYRHVFLRNVARSPGIDRFAACDTPEIGGHLASGGFQAVLVMGWHLKSYLQAIFAAKQHGIPLMVRGDSHLQTPRSGWKKNLKAIVYPPFLRLFDCALYVGQRSRDYWLHYGYPAERLFFSPHCVDNDWFAIRARREERGALRASFGFSKESKVILFAGKLLPFKRPLDVVAAVSQLQQRGADVVLLVAGSGPLENELLTAGRENGVFVKYLGFCNQTEMPLAYVVADVMVLPSDGNETWGLVVNEALACGTPVIVSDMVGCAPDLVADGKVGRVFQKGDVTGLVRAITQVLAEPPIQCALAERSARYSIGVAVDGIKLALQSEYVQGKARRLSEASQAG